uniref:ATP synthase epsilon chain, chloroplastic n=2 Tax=Corallina TaxID=35169 RepID=A0A6M3WA70_COROI|nr:ATP synthase epsilon subunit [Corallina officinalis]QJF58549.1 ATP synthase epsilon subunit [Corallina officinalis]QJF58748.1 ATP synthase epsilon subunit [Corallina officinalis]QJF58947.1 ATP synthase epsilon subunit [Corallina officinalis]
MYMTLKIRVIAPDRTVWNADAEEVILPSSTGQLGILTGHIPLLTALDIGVMRVRIEKDWIPIVLLGGFAEVENNIITILVNGAEEASEINIDKAKVHLEQAVSLLAEAETNKEKIEATQQIRKARARVQAGTVTNS